MQHTTTIYDYKCYITDTQADTRSWYVAIYRITQYIGPDYKNCGSTSQPCCHLSSVMNQINDGDTVVLTSGDDTKNGKLFVIQVT